MITQQRAEPGPLLVLDAGGSLWAGAPPAGAALEQARLKATLILNTWAADGIDAAGLGPDDLGLDPAWVVGAAAAAGVPLVATNLQCPGVDLPRSRRVQAGDRAVLFVGVWGPGPAGAGCTATSPADAVAETIAADTAAAGSAAALVVAMGALDEADLRAVAARLPAGGLFIDGRSAAPTPSPVVVAPGALRVGAGARGKAVGLATVRWRAGATQGLAAAANPEERVRRIERLQQRIETAALQAERAAAPEARARAAERVRTLRAELDAAQAPERAQPAAHALELTLMGLGAEVADAPAAAAALAAAKSAIEDAGRAATPRSASAAGVYAGAEACAGCHPAAFAQWQQTPHAAAWTHLVDAQRSMDLACWGCHATGARQPGGPQTPAEVGGLAAVQCEACHGAAAAHVADPGGVRPVRSPVLDVCVRCHDGAQDGGRFDPATYVPRVHHGPAHAPGGG